MFEIFINGTGGTMPIPNRFLCSCALRYNGKVLLLDCGEGTQLAYLKSNWGFNDIDAIFLSHSHTDHTAGLSGILLQMKNAGRTKAISIFAPQYLENIVKASITICDCNLHFDINFIAIDNLEPISWNDLTLSFIKLNHYPTSYGIKITSNRKRLFNPQKAKELEIPQYLWRELHNNKSVIVNGKTYLPDMVLDRPKTNLSFCYIPDTKFTHLFAVKSFVKNSDLTICECMYPTRDELKNQEDKYHVALPWIFTSSLDSCTKRLGLIHFSPAYRNVKKSFFYDKTKHPNVFLCEDGQLITLNYVD